MECKDCPNKKKCRRQCMKLPDGKTCGDCDSFGWCKMVYGVKSKRISCHFEPIRFKQKEEQE